MAARSFAAPLSAVDKLETGAGDTVTATEDIVATATKDIVAGDPYLAGHYPHFTIYPGVFCIETVYQAAREVLGRDGAEVTLAGIVSVHFKSPLLPGDRLTAELTFRPSAEEPWIVRVRAKCRRGDGQSSGSVTLAMRVTG